MKSSSRAIGQRFTGFGTGGFHLATLRPVFPRAAFGYLLAVVSVAAALGIKLILQHFNVGYPLSSSFLAAIAVAFWYGGTGPGVLSVLLSFFAFGYFVLPQEIDYQVVLPDGSTKLVYVTGHGRSQLPYFIYFAVVALLMSWFSSSRRRAEQLLLQARAELEAKVDERTASLTRANEELQAEIADRNCAEEKLRKSQQKYRDLIEFSPDPIFVIDAQGNFALANPAGLKLAGCAEEELIGQPVDTTYLAEERALFWQRLDELKAKGPFRFERRFLRRNGDIIFVEASLSPMRGGYFQVMMRDISKRKQAEEALRASEQVARGQVEALAQSLDVLATAPEPEQFIGTMLATIGRLLGGKSVTLWLFDEATDSLVLRLVVEGANPAASDSDHPLMKDPLSWKTNPLIQELLFTAGPVVCDDIETDPRVSDEWREYFKTKSTKKFLAVPILIGGHVRGFITVRHAERKPYRPAEIELTQALAHQVMLAIQLNEFAEQSQRAAIVEERNRMARDIHDTLAQGFTGVIVQLEAAEDAISCGHQKEADKHLHRAAGLARQSLSEARRSVHALRPQALQRGNFWDALKGIIKNTTNGTALQTKVQLRGRVRKLPPQWQENLLHIGQEALTNTLKHAHAHRFEAHLTFNENELRLELYDDGDGFKTNGQRGGLGLAGMQERVEQMGASLSVTSSRGQGTKLVVVSPYQREVL